MPGRSASLPPNVPTMTRQGQAACGLGRAAHRRRPRVRRQSQSAQLDRRDHRESASPSQQAGRHAEWKRRRATQLRRPSYCGIQEALRPHPRVILPTVEEILRDWWMEWSRNQEWRYLLGKAKDMKLGLAGQTNIDPLKSPRRESHSSRKRFTKTADAVSPISSAAVKKIGETQPVAYSVFPTSLLLHLVCRRAIAPWDRLIEHAQVDAQLAHGDGSRGRAPNCGKLHTWIHQSRPGHRRRTSSSCPTFRARNRPDRFSPWPPAG